MQDQAVTRQPRAWVNALLVCGILSSIIYVATDWLAAGRWPGYRIADRMLSDLLAVGTPTRGFIVGPMTAYNVLIIAFGIGVWFSASKRSVRTSAVLLVLYGMVSEIGLVLFPLHYQGGQLVGGGLGHSLATLSLVLFMFAFIGFGSGAAGSGFRWYSILTILAVLVGGILAGAMIPQIAKGLPTPGLGIVERLNIYASMLWVAVFAIVLLRANRARVSLSGTPLTTDAPPTRTVTAFVGSGHRGGATYTATRALLDKLEAFGDVRGEIVLLSEYNIGVCRGCKVCFDRGEEHCPLKDDRDVLVRKMDEADAIILATPNYSFQVSGLMKIFLDRLGFAFHRPRFHGKTATAIVVQGFFRGRDIRKYLEFAEGGLGFNVVKGSVHKTLEPMPEKAIRDMDKKLAEQAQRFHERLMQPAYPKPSMIGLMAFRMSRSGIEMSVPADKRDYQYYGHHGWFESDYYYPTHLGLFMRVAGRLFDWAAVHTSTFEVGDEPNGRPGAASSRPAAE